MQATNTTIYSLPAEVLRLIFIDLAHSFTPHKVLQCALICRAWSEEFLPLLYQSVTLSTKAQIRAFVKSPVKEQYRVTALSLFAEFPNEDREEEADVLAELFGSLTGQLLGTLVIGESVHFPLDLLADPTVSEIETLSLGCSDYATVNDDAWKDVKMRLKSLSFSDMGLLAFFDERKRSPFLTAILSPTPPHDTPTIRQLDLATAEWGSSALPDDVLNRFRPIFPFLSSFALPSIPDDTTAFTEPLYEALRLSTSVAHLSLSFSDCTSFNADKRHLGNSLTSISPSLSSLTLCMRSLNKCDISELLEDCIIPIITKFINLPKSPLSKLKVFRLEGMGTVKMEHIGEGPEFVEGLRVGGIKFEVC